MYESGYYHHREFSQEHIRRVRSFYLPFFHDAERILELGCGRGEFLELLKGQGKRVAGIELDPVMAEEARFKGIDVRVADALETLRAGAHEEFDAIIAAHLLEHLPVSGGDELIALAKKCLCHGGILCLIVPNVGSFPVLSEEFWNDPTHVRPYGHELLAYLASKHGMRVLGAGANPVDHGGYPIDLDSLEVGRESPLRRMGAAEFGHVRMQIAQFESQLKKAQASGASADVQEIWQASIWALRAHEKELADLHQRVAEINEHNLYLNHQLGVMGRNLRRIVEILYAPNEFYLVCQKG